MLYKENFGEISIEVLEKRYNKNKTASITALVVSILILLVDILFTGPNSGMELSGFMGAFIGLAIFFSRRTHIAKRALNNFKKAG